MTAKEARILIDEIELEKVGKAGERVGIKRM